MYKSNNKQITGNIIDISSKGNCLTINQITISEKLPRRPDQVIVKTKSA